MINSTSEKLAMDAYKHLPPSRTYSHNGHGALHLIYDDLIAIVSPVFKRSGWFIRYVAGYKLQIITGKFQMFQYLSGSEQFRKTLTEFGSIEEIKDLLEAQRKAA